MKGYQDLLGRLAQTAREGKANCPSDANAGTPGDLTQAHIQCTACQVDYLPNEPKRRRDDHAAFLTGINEGRQRV